MVHRLQEHDFHIWMSKTPVRLGVSWGIIEEKKGYKGHILFRGAVPDLLKKTVESFLEEFGGFPGLFDFISRRLAAVIFVPPKHTGVLHPVDQDRFVLEVLRHVAV